MDALPSGATDALNKVLASARPAHALDAAAALAALWTFVKLYRAARRRLRTTRLRGPSSPSFVYGVGKELMESDDAGAMYETWAEEYGVVYQVPSTLGKTRIVLCDPKAIAHFYARETWTYIQTPVTKAALEHGFGRGLLWSHGESHRRQRKSLTPAFSNAAIRRLTSVFYDSAYKAKGVWDALIESSGNDSTIIDVQNWMNHISLDTIGLAGFSHDFGSLDGKPASVTEIFDTFGSSPRSSTLNIGATLLAQAFPFLVRIPTARTKLIGKLNNAMGDISNILLERTRKEVEIGVTSEKEDKSIIGLLIKGESSDGELHLSQEEIMAQMKVLLLAGYETTSISLTWALIELSQNPDVQTKLRNELLEHGTDPTYDQLSSNLPYLDAVVHEILRIHPPVPEFTRIALEDDVIPLSEPVRTKSGKLVDSLSIAKGTLLAISIPSINRSTAIWGPDAKVFRPSRWLEDETGQDGIPTKAKEVQGHRHLLTFVDGPRTCLGKSFAVAEFKTVLSVLVKNFVFEMRDGPETKLEMGRGVLPRPKVVGEVGCKMPLRVRRFEG
ncbi:hypothetical protein HYDPIDRAFT_101898 [Hydnomerulius pinastri MD-312]|uniref:Cytochrome P450 n=1 Tax=Hydnomerulius pinastri MD-312 TaxID=994086 RepID=A0A0C9W886_9AGAM|nr:hypothetical protein HYDPIDRAFT_101898 [Hydnomerulius pinastri MD-312]